MIHRFGGILVQFASLATITFSIACSSVCLASEAPSKPLIDLADSQSVHRLEPSSTQVSVTREGKSAVAVAIAPGHDDYPGVALHPSDGKTWDLSSYGDVRASLVNTGSKPISLAMRIDNPGSWQNNNSENLSLQPNESGEIRIIFGNSFGHKPAYALKPAAIVQLLLFAGKSAEPQSFRIESIEASGPPGETPPVDPAALRTTPPDGYLLGNNVKIDPATQLVLPAGITASIDPASHEIVLVESASTKDEAAVLLKPMVGRWDLRAGSQVRIILKNLGKHSLTPQARLESDAGPTDSVAPSKAIDPGAEGELVVLFTPALTWRGAPHGENNGSLEGQPQTGTRFSSEAVSGVKLVLPATSNAQSLAIRAVRLESPPATVPDSLGQRPPVAGDWIKTFDDEFDGTSVDATKWNVVGRNYYDKVSRFVKENVVVGGGVARLRYEKRPGPWANKADGATTDYATGFLDTYGKWTQRYGYFEARMKLPRSPGLWPAFWMMPDRGAAYVGDRGSTADGGMEFDIMEHLTRWGPFRYNIAMHWDGYGKEHKSTGTEKVYVESDKDGFITAGLLWTPGSAVYYCNGKEVARWDDPRVSSVPADLMFTLPSGGWDNNVVDDRKLPDDFQIDYVRCWQRKDLTTP